MTHGQQQKGEDVYDTKKLLYVTRNNFKENLQSIIMFSTWDFNIQKTASYSGVNDNVGTNHHWDPRKVMQYMRTQG